MKTIGDAALVLSIHENEAHVGQIVEGLVSACALAFQAPPTTFLHLEQLTVVDRNMFTLIRREP
jgi:hypothetical protein